MKFLLLRRFLFAAALIIAAQAAFAAAHTPLYTMRVRGPFQFKDARTLYCDASYSVAECRRQLEILLNGLKRYPSGLAPNWKWVLVSAEHWKPMLTSFHLDYDSPAVTILDEQVTLLDESLIKPLPERAAELMDGFQIRLDELLDVAISHELGHAICHETNEARADDIGRALRKSIASGEPVIATCLRPVRNTGREGK